MKRVFSGLALALIPALIAMPALAAVDVVPAAQRSGSAWLCLRSRR